MCGGECSSVYAVQTVKELFEQFTKEMRERFTEELGDWLQKELGKIELKEYSWEEMGDVLYPVEKKMRTKFGDAAADWFCETWEEGL